jgi:hypothetical protein
VMTGAEEGTAAGRATTVTNDEKGLINAETMGEVAEAINETVSDIINSTNGVTGINLRNAPEAAGKFTMSDGADGLPNTSDDIMTITGDIDLGSTSKNYYINNQVVATKSLTGKGTLVFNAGFSTSKDVNWTGDVIVANNPKAIVEVTASGAKFTVSNVLSVQGYGSGTATQMGIRLKGSLVVGTDADPGIMLILGDQNTKNPLAFESGATGVDVHGIFTIMGNALRMDFDDGSKIKVKGSLAMIVPEDATTGVTVNIFNSAHLDLEFTDTMFDGAIDALSSFYVPDDGGDTPIQPVSFLEDPSRQRTLLDGHITADEDEPTIYGFVP